MASLSCVAFVMSTRIDSFNGSREAYIAFLECEVVRLRAILQGRPSNEQNREWSIERSLPATQNTTPSQGTAPPQSRSNKRPSRSLGTSSSTPPETRNLEIISWQPKAKKCKPTPQQDAGYWRKRADQLIQQTPARKDWLRFIEDHGLYDLVRSGKIVPCLLQHNESGSLSVSAKVSTRADHFSDCPPLLQRIATFAEAAAKDELAASTSLMIANFRHFVVLSACVVLRGIRKNDNPHILDIVRICLGKNVTDKHCLRILTTVSYMNRLIDLLDAQGWTMRATLLMLMWNQSLSFYLPLAQSPDHTLPYLASALSSERFTTVQPATEQAGATGCVGLFIPFLVSELLGREIHIARVAHELRYIHADVLGEPAPYVNPFIVFNQLQD